MFAPPSRRCRPPATAARTPAGSGQSAPQPPPSPPWLIGMSSTVGGASAHEVECAHDYPGAFMTATGEVRGSILGNAVIRLEDPGVLRGETRYFDDLRFDGMTHVAFVRSTMAHARITELDASAAREMP